mmetsp:Transcript_5114/g.9314  ORF Transcript_5114/g.9314 Transcript_5114/m.9314 type:complete len:336 (-) Transcript_5114:483-1490(-)
MPKTSLSSHIIDSFFMLDQSSDQRNLLRLLLEFHSQMSRQGEQTPALGGKDIAMAVSDPAFLDFLLRRNLIERSEADLDTARKQRMLMEQLQQQQLQQHMQQSSTLLHQQIYPQRHHEVEVMPPVHNTVGQEPHEYAHAQFSMHHPPASQPSRYALPGAPQGALEQLQSHANPYQMQSEVPSHLMKTKSSVGNNIVYSPSDPTIPSLENSKHLDLQEPVDMKSRIRKPATTTVSAEDLRESKDDSMHGGGDSSSTELDARNMVISSDQPDKPYYCKSCGHYFTRKWHAIDHAKRVHLGIKPFVCDVCGARFKQKCTLQRHAHVAHSASALMDMQG